MVKHKVFLCELGLLLTLQPVRSSVCPFGLNLLPFADLSGALVSTMLSCLMEMLAKTKSKTQLRSQNSPLTAVLVMRYIFLSVFSRLCALCSAPVNTANLGADSDLALSSESPA